MGSTAEDLAHKSMPKTIKALAASPRFSTESDDVGFLGSFFAFRRH